MARRVLAVVACVSSARALVAPVVQPARAAPARTAATLTEVETKEALPLSSVVLDEEEERRLKKERRLAAAETSLDVFVVGLSHHNAKVEVREKLAIPQDEWSESAQAIVDDSNGAIAEAAVLSTCNRFEVYFSALGQMVRETAAGAGEQLGQSLDEMRELVRQLEELLGEQGMELSELARALLEQPLEPGVDRPLDAGPGRCGAESLTDITEGEVRGLLVRLGPVVDHVSGEVVLPRGDHPEQRLALHVHEHRQVRDPGPREAPLRESFPPPHPAPEGSSPIQSPLSGVPR